MIVALAGCGSASNGVASKTPEQILAAAKSAAQNASGVHITGVSRVGATSLTLNAALAKDTGHAKIAFYGFAFEAIRDGDTLYVKGNQAFTEQLEHTLGVKLPSGTWVKTPTTGALAQTAAFTSKDSELPVVLSTDGPLTKGNTATIDGQPAIALHEAAKLYTGTLYVATTGQPYPLLLRKTGQETGETKFTDWDKPVTVDPPANAVELSQLQHHR